MTQPTYLSRHLEQETIQVSDGPASPAFAQVPQVESIGSTILLAQTSIEGTTEPKIFPALKTLTYGEAPKARARLLFQLKEALAIQCAFAEDDEVNVQNILEYCSHLATIIHSFGKAAKDKRWHPLSHDELQLLIALLTKMQESSSDPESIEKAVKGVLLLVHMQQPKDFQQEMKQVITRSLQLAAISPHSWKTLGYNSSGHQLVTLLKSASGFSVYREILQEHDQFLLAALETCAATGVSHFSRLETVFFFSRLGSVADAPIALDRHSIMLRAVTLFTKRLYSQDSQDIGDGIRIILAGIKSDEVVVESLETYLVFINLGKLARHNYFTALPVETMTVLKNLFEGLQRIFEKMEIKEAAEFMVASRNLAEKNCLPRMPNGNWDALLEPFNSIGPLCEDTATAVYTLLVEIGNLCELKRVPYFTVAGQIKLKSLLIKYKEYMEGEEQHAGNRLPLLRSLGEMARSYPVLETQLFYCIVPKILRNFDIDHLTIQEVAEACSAIESSLRWDITEPTRPSDFLIAILKVYKPLKLRLIGYIFKRQIGGNEETRKRKRGVQE